MTLRDDLASALQAALTPLVADLGSRCTIYRAALSSQADGAPRRTYLADPDWTNVSVVFAAGTNDAGSDATDSVIKPFGVRSSARATATFLRHAIGLPHLLAFDGIMMLDGPYAGFTWLAEADSAADPIGASTSVRLIAAPPGVLS